MGPLAPSICTEPDSTAMSYSTQWSQVPRGASGSSTMRTRVSVPSGIPTTSSDGEESSPSHVKGTGIDAPGPNAVELIPKAGASVVVVEASVDVGLDVVDVLVSCVVVVVIVGSVD